MKQYEHSSSVSWVSTLAWPDLVVPICDRLGRDIFANDSIGANDCVRANPDISHDHRSGINSNMVFQRGVLIGFFKPLPSSPDRDILINRDAMPDPHFTAYHDTDRVREVDVVQIAEWNLAASNFLQEGPKDCQLCLQESAAFLQATVRSSETAM